MYRKTWKIPVDGEEHRVELNWSYWGGAREVLADGKVVNHDRMPMRWRSEQTFDLAGHEVKVITKPSKPLSGYFKIELTVDGSPVASDDAPTFWETKKG